MICHVCSLPSLHTFILITFSFAFHCSVMEVSTKGCRVSKRPIKAQQNKVCKRLLLVQIIGQMRSHDFTHPSDPQVTERWATTSPDCKKYSPNNLAHLRNSRRMLTCKLGSSSSSVRIQKVIPVRLIGICHSACLQPKGKMNIYTSLDPLRINIYKG